MHLIKTTDTPFYTFLTGGAGVGKSHVTKALYQAVIKHLNMRAGDDFNKIRAILLAPTGKAAYNIQGKTIHSTFNIPANQNLKNYKSLDSSRLNILRAELSSLKVIFLDEVSMVGSSMFNLQINKRLQDIMGNKSDFGGVSIVAIGDLFQLQPVFDRYLFDSLETPYGPLACNLWNKHFRMFELQEIMRQKESKTFAQILNRLREGLTTPEDINKLKERICSSQTESEALNHIPHLFIQNKRVEEFNLLMHNKAHGPKFVIQAIDSVIGAQTEKLKDQILKQIPVDDPNKAVTYSLKYCSW